MERFIHQHPESKEEQDHEIELIVDDEVVGHARLHYFSKPLPFYSLDDLYVDESKQGEGYGSKIMDFIEKMLKEKGKAGLLLDAIDPTSTASGMYRRRGWIKVPGYRNQTDHYAFNLPATANIDEIALALEGRGHL
jgi:GNAT superfamily N-acetyltransferase